MSDTEARREREHLAFGRVIDWEREGLFGTVFFGPSKHRDFPPLPVGNIRALIEAGYLDPDSAHNEAPHAGELVEWAEDVQDEYRDYQFEIGLIGYLVDPSRPDSRIRLEGVSIQSPGPIPESLKQDAAARFHADTLRVDDFDIVLMWD